MNSIVLFLLKSVIVSAILTTWYLLGLRNKRLHQYNRWYLLFTLYASIQLPLLHLRLFTLSSAPSVPPAPVRLFREVIGDRETGGQVVSAIAPQSGFNWSAALLIIAVAISCILFLVLVGRIVWLISIVRRYRVIQVAGVPFINTDLASAPFSFLNYLFWKEGISLASESGSLILRHELVHIKQRHTYDKLASQLCCCICWMNPFYWFIQKELGMIHEFIADEAAIGGNDTEAFAKMLLQSHNNGSYLAAEHRFFSSPIKRRLTMLQTNSKSSHLLLRRLLAIPVLAGSVLIFSFSAGHSVVPAEKKIVLVVDPGHGGNDAGAKYGSVSEKDINLKIATRIKELSKDYNIDVVLTRTGDKALAIDERVARSNKLAPDDFISIHINNEPAADTGKGNFDVAVSYDNKDKAHAEQLGNAVFDNVLQHGGIQGHRRSWSESRSLGILKNNKTPGLVLILGEISNKEKMQIVNDAHLDELCNAILKGVVESHKIQ